MKTSGRGIARIGPRPRAAFNEHAARVEAAVALTDQPRRYEE
jgi:hypothetical protein